MEVSIGRFNEGKGREEERREVEGRKKVGERGRRWKGVVGGRGGSGRR